MRDPAMLDFSGTLLQTGWTWVIAGLCLSVLLAHLLVEQAQGFLR